MADFLIKTQNLTKSYGAKSVVSHASIEIPAGKIVGLVGKNGAGKTTLLRMLTGLCRPDDGRMLLFGSSTEAGCNAARTRIGSMIETPDFYPNLSAERNLEYYRLLKGIPERDSVARALAIAGIADTGKKPFKHFSLGMKQKLGLALAVLGTPDLLILDEPINGMDPMAIAEFRELILRLNREKRMTILISSHILAELSQIASDYIFIDRGTVIEQSSAEAIYAKCRTHIAAVVDDAAHAAAILERTLNCREFEVVSPTKLRIFAFTETPELVSRAFFGDGVTISTLNVEGGNIEDYFVKLVGGDHV